MTAKKSGHMWEIVIGATVIGGVLWYFYAQNTAAAAAGDSPAAANASGGTTASMSDGNCSATVPGAVCLGF